MGVPGEGIAHRDGQGSGAAVEIRAARFELLEGLSAGMVHEARNPLNAMAIHLEVLADKLRDEVLGEVPAHLQKNLQAARNQIRRLDQILRRYGDFASGRPTESQPDLATLWDQATGLCDYQVRRAGVRLDVEIPASIRPVGDATLLCQTLIELLLLGLAKSALGSLRVVARWHDEQILIDMIAAGGAIQGNPPHLHEGERVPDLEVLRSLALALDGALESSTGEAYSCRLRLPGRPG